MVLINRTTFLNNAGNSRIDGIVNPVAYPQSACANTLSRTAKLCGQSSCRCQGLASP